MTVMTPASAGVAQARATLAAAYAAQPVEYLSFFGVTTYDLRRKTLFVWRNYFTGAWGLVARAQPHEVEDVALALLAELRTLREAKKPQSAAPMRRRKSA